MFVSALALHPGLGQRLFQAFHTGARGGFGHAHVAAWLWLTALPMSFKANSVVISVALKGFELANPVDDPSTHRCPLESAVRLANRVFAVAVADAVLGQVVVVVGVGHVAGEGGGVSWVPVEH